MRKRGNYNNNNKYIHTYVHSNLLYSTTNQFGVKNTIENRIHNKY